MIHSRILWLVILALCFCGLSACDDSESSEDGDTDTCTEGDTKDAEDGCNTCTCEEGSWHCTEMACADDDDDDDDNSQEDGDDPDGDDSDGDDEQEPVENLGYKAGFMDIEPVAFTLGGTKEFESSEARLWYTFQPADTNPEDRPIFVFFNGGPGSSTGILFGFNTAKKTLDPQVIGDTPVGDNPTSWTAMGNLLFIDARQTGFSYNLMDDVSNEEARVDEFDAQNFNCLVDGADFVRVLLRFMKRHPDLQDNPVIIAGESYGGIRSTVMLYLLLNYQSLADGSFIYQDPALTEEIQDHLDRTFPEEAGSAFEGAAVARQFGWQVLIQPLLSGVYQNEITGQMWEEPGSLIYQLEEESGVDFIPCSEQGRSCDPENNALYYVWYTLGRDPYYYKEQDGWMDALIETVVSNLLTVSVLEQALEMDPATLDAFYAEARQRAYRMASTDERLYRDETGKRVPFEKLTRIPFVDRMKTARALAKKGDPLTEGDFPDTFGDLQSWDKYYLSLNELVNRAFYYNSAMSLAVDPYSTLYGEMFLKNAAQVESFITNAAYDLVIFAPAIAPSLAMHTDLVQEAVHDQEPRDGVARPGWIRLTYQSGAFDDIPELTTREIRFPLYSESCHAVEMTEPQALFDDVQTWVTEKLR